MVNEIDWDTLEPVPTIFYAKGPNFLGIHRRESDVIWKVLLKDGVKTTWAIGREWLLVGGDKKENAHRHHGGLRN